MSPRNGAFAVSFAQADWVTQYCRCTRREAQPMDKHASLLKLLYSTSSTRSTMFSAASKPLLASDALLTLPWSLVRILSRP